MLHASRESGGTGSQDVNLCAVNAVGVNLWISGRKIVSVVLLCIPVLFAFWIETKKPLQGDYSCRGYFHRELSSSATPTHQPNIPASNVPMNNKAHSITLSSLPV